MPRVNKRLRESHLPRDVMQPRNEAGDNLRVTAIGPAFAPRFARRQAYEPVRPY